MKPSSYFGRILQRCTRGVSLQLVLFFQRQLKTDPLNGNVASLKLTHPWRLSVG
ncbi:hypothetical protein ATI45_2576 [Marinobacter sp. LV10MA510-1]|nr:hypothetical protein ATI45_2576 [Marinobacter sp. LV10MA510-1]